MNIQKVTNNNKILINTIISSALERFYLSPNEYELFVELNNEKVEEFTFNYLCSNCNKVHQDIVYGIKLNNNYFVVCQLPKYFLIAPYYILGYVLPHENNIFNLTDSMNQIENVISLNIDPLHLVDNPVLAKAEEMIKQMFGDKYKFDDEDDNNKALPLGLTPFNLN